MKQESVISNVLLKHAFIYETVDMKISHLTNNNFVNQTLKFKCIHFVQAVY